MLRKLEIDALKADLASVEALLQNRSMESDPFGYMQFVQRKELLEKSLRAAILRPSAHAELGIFFGGRPVQGSRGIEADFAGKALEDVQTLISKRYSGREVGPLKDRGRVPGRDQSQLLVTNVMRGSFGFVLEEAGDTHEIVNTPLKDVVDEVSDILARLGAADEALFDEAAAQMDERMLVTLKSFFQLLDDAGATMRVVQGERDFLLDRDAVSLAKERVKEMEIVESEKEYSGELYVLPASKRFDLITQTGATKVVFKGTVSPYVLKQLAGQLEMDEPPIDVRMISQKRWRVQMKAREIRERNRAPRFVYSLHRLLGPVE